MLEFPTFAVYNLAIGAVTGVGLLYFLFFRPTVVDYHRHLLFTVSGILLFLVGGPLTELLVPSLVHWVHGTASVLVVIGLYSPVTSELRQDAWADVLLRNPERVRQSDEWMLPVDDAILELFHSKELVLTPAIIAYNIDYSREEVNRRLVELESRGFVREGRARKVPDNEPRKPVHRGQTPE
ncbi:ArsR family transcriptional regulator [Natronococcus wangiae]|uniref:ArsR family transcriptional regulator n=1 Tax=Natronococcus wangiae TaxID=3068275 RepID=UPI00273F3DA9|nr:ArsR family transcriptional regulator [Natronococcus sp. AD5]